MHGIRSTVHVHTLCFSGDSCKMALTKLHGKDLAEYDLDLDNIDELLAQLTPEELAQLELEIIDPDVSSVIDFVLFNLCTTKLFLF